MLLGMTVEIRIAGTADRNGSSAVSGDSTSPPSRSPNSTHPAARRAVRIASACRSYSVSNGRPSAPTAGPLSLREPGRHHRMGITVERQERAGGPSDVVATPTRSCPIRAPESGSRLCRPRSWRSGRSALTRTDRPHNDLRAIDEDLDVVLMLQRRVHPAL